MKELVRGQYYGIHKYNLNFDNFLLSSTEYTHDKVDWHYHENPYFTYLLKGNLIETNKKGTHYLKPSSLLFHNWEDAHYNIKPPGYVHGFHIELTKNWFKKQDDFSSNIEGSFSIDNPLVIQQMNQIVLESSFTDQFTETSIELSILSLLDSMSNTKGDANKPPKWVIQIKEIINDESEVCTSLSNLSTLLNVHPVHISRGFSKYFNTSLGNYIRLIKVNKAVSLLLNSKYSLTEIAYICQFFDQSHFIKSFKSVYGMTPLAFLKKSK